MICFYVDVYLSYVRDKTLYLYIIVYFFSIENLVPFGSSDEY